MSERAYIALGSNVGDRGAQLSAARSAIGSLSATRLVAATRIEETAPFGSGAQGAYFNQLVAVETNLPPLALLRALQRIERTHGRARFRRWGARTLDLDVVRYGDRTMTSPELTLPHPGLARRDFWRRELHELERLERRLAVRSR